LPEFVLADLLTLAPALRLRFPDVPPNPPLDPQSEQQRLFESVVAFYQALSEHTPLLLVLEDAHWGDSGTLSLLRYLARRARRHRIFLVATYREVELDATRPFRQVLLDLQRERLAERPEGNPFFIEEVCKALVESGEVYFADGRWDRLSMEELEIPQSVRVAIQSRVGKLPARVQETLRLAAILGREFDFETLVEASALARASDQGEDTLVDALEAAERAQLIDEVSAEGDETFSFTHALIPATLAEGLSGLRRRRMHRQVLAAIERLRPDDLESLAFHALEAGNLQKGLDYSLRAGEKAQRLYASEDALLHYERAREIAESLDLPEQLLTIYEAIGEAQFLRDVPGSIDAFEQALNLASASEKRAAIQSKLGTACAYVNDERGWQFLETAVSVLDPITQGNDLARALTNIGRFHHNHGHHRQALTYLEQARLIAEPLGEPLTLALIYGGLAGAHQQLADLNTSIEWARRTVAFGERKDYPLAIVVGSLYLAQASAMMGEWQDALRIAGQDLQIAERTGLLTMAAWAEDSLARAYHGLGDLPAAEEAAQTSLDLTDEIGESRLAVFAGSRLSIIQSDLGKVEIAGEHARRAVDRGIDLDSPQMLCGSLEALAYWHMQREEWQKAFGHLSQLADVLAETDNHHEPLARGPQYAEASLRVGQLEKAAEVVERTLVLAKEAPSPHIEAVTRRVQAQILVAQGAWDQAARCFDDAIARLEQLGSRLELGRALYHRGEMQAKRGEADGARGSLTRALEIFQDCSAKIDAGRARTALNSLETGE
jgi:tetratricopeptide (TPR) repeat protein